MPEHEGLVREEIRATVDRAGFEVLDPETIRVDVTDSFRRRLGECRQVSLSAATAREEETETEIETERETETERVDQATGYEVRIASRLFDGGRDDRWRDTVRHEVAHAYVLETVGPQAPPHGDAWRAAARRAGADPIARYEGDAAVDADYVLACPNGCFEREYVQRSGRVKTPWRYTCGECDTALVSYDVGDRPSDPEPGTCYVRHGRLRT